MSKPKKKENKRKGSSYLWEAVTLTYGLWLMMRGTIKIFVYDTSTFFRILFVIFLISFGIFVNTVFHKVEDNAVRRVKENG